MPCAVVLLEFQHNPEEHFSFIPLQNDGMHIAETLRQDGHVNIWRISQTWELDTFYLMIVVTWTVLHKFLAELL